MDKKKDNLDVIKALLAKVGEKSENPLKTNLEKFSMAILKNFEKNSDFVIDMIFQCVTNLTYKIGVYGALVGLVNLSEEQMGKSVVKRLSRDFNAALKEKNFKKIPIFVRFSAELAVFNVLSLKDFLALLNSLLDCITKVKSKEMADFLFYCVFGVLPHCGYSLLKKAPDDFTQILERLTAYSEKRIPSRALKYNMVLRDSDKDSDFIGNYWKAMMEASDREWESEVLISPSRQFGNRFEKAQSHSFEIPTFYFNINPSEAPKICQVVSILTLEENEDKEEMKQSLNRFLLFEYFCDIMFHLQDSRKICAEQLLFLAEKNNAHCLLIESVFSLLMQLPEAQSNASWYSCVFIELFTQSKSVVPKLLRKCLMRLFDRMESLDVECRDRLSNWFSVHLANFGYKWAWQNWSFVATMSEISPKRVFCESILRYCSEQCRPDSNPNVEGLKSLIPSSVSIKETFKEAFTKAQNEIQDEETNFSFGKEEEKTEQTNDNDQKQKYSSEKIEKEISSKEQLAVELMKQILSKKELETTLKLLLDSVSKGFSKVEIVRIFFGCILFSGSEKLSDLFRLFDRYKQLITDLKLNEEEKTMLVSITMDSWSESHLHLSVILLKLISYGFVKFNEILNVLLSEENLSKFYRPFYSKVLINLLDIYSKRLTVLSRIREKVVQDDRIESIENREKLDNRIFEAHKDRQELLKKVIIRLTTAADYFIRKMAGFEDNELFKEIFGRLVMFVRKFRNDVIDMKDDLVKNVFAENKDLATGKLFYDIVDGL